MESVFFLGSCLCVDPRTSDYLADALVRAVFSGCLFSEDLRTVM